MTKPSTRPASLIAHLARAVLVLGASGMLALPLGGTHPAFAGTALAPPGWSQVASLPGTFKVRWNFSDAYYPPSDQVVVFGGAPKAGGEGYYNDTWVYTDNAWVPGPAAPSGLTGRGGAAMAYDPAIGKIVLFGGQTAPSGTSWLPSNQTWLYNGTSWTAGPAAPAGLAGRTGAEMVYDPDIGKVVLFGGSGAAVYTDVWLFDGTSWTQGVAPPAGVLPREFFGMSYDATLHDVVIAGGDGGTDVWYFTGSAWSAGPAMPVAMGPKERAAMDYDVQLKGDVMFGGLGPGITTDDAWVLRDGVWSKVGQACCTSWPVARLSAGVLWHPVAHALMVFSGIDDGGGDLGKTGYTDTWLFNDPLLPTPTGVPGGNDPTTGYGFDPNESVAFKMDSATSATLLTAKADVSGQFVRIQVPLPAVLTGGGHTMYAIGQTSGVALTGSVTVSPAATLTVKQLAYGDSTNFVGSGYLPGEQVSVSFPGGTAIPKAADATGSVNVAITMPHEPYPGSVVTGSAPSGKATSSYTVKDTVAGPSSAHSGSSYTITLTGYQASEKVNLKWQDTGTVFATVTVGSNGYAAPSVKLTHANGYVKIVSVGLTSGQTATSSSVHFT